MLYLPILVGCTWTLIDRDEHRARDDTEAVCSIIYNQYLRCTPNVILSDEERDVDLTQAYHLRAATILQRCSQLLSY